MNNQIVDCPSHGKGFSNYVKTTKFTIWNFVPLALFYQYKRLANCYFLVLCILGAIP
jgi:phospholipid-translocating ATPase